MKEKRIFEKVFDDQEENDIERINLEDYAKAVTACIDLARQPTGGGRVTAQVLLSAYNGYSFQLDVSDLCSLDYCNYKIALKVIRGRCETGREPQEVIANGDSVFSALWNQWKHLELAERAKRTCPDCHGHGKIYINPKDEDDMRTEQCARCAGAGRICRCK